jgi:SAM-dependent methyltransferase
MPPTSGHPPQPGTSLRVDCVNLGVTAVMLVIASLAIDVMMDRMPEGMEFVLLGGALFWCLPIAGYLQRDRIRRMASRLERVAEADPAESTPNLLDLFLISFIVLFVETMLIRYIGSQTRIFAFYKNIALIGAFLGLGIGCFRGGGGRREALLFLAGMPALGLFFAVAAQALGAVLGASATLASSERVFGYGYFSGASWFITLFCNIQIGLYCAAVFLAVAWLFGHLGRLLGAQFAGVGRIRAYSVNITGSLAGVAAFAALSRAHTSPWLWFLVGLVPLLHWLGRGRTLKLGMAFAAAAVLFVAPQAYDTVWSSYQKLVGHATPDGYEIDISDTNYQVARDLRPEAIQRLGSDPDPHYNAELAGHAVLDNVLVVGAGSGNDVAAALRAGARHVDAVDIDPVIIGMGRLHHPERPYDDPRVRVIVDDARHAFRTLPPQSYDAVVFGLLDSHTQLGASSVRLDNYVFTQESFAAAARLVRPGGTLTITVLTGVKWMHERYAVMLEHTCGGPVATRQFGNYSLYSCSPVSIDPDPARTGAELGAPTDDWPFPYLPGRGVPFSYVLVIGVLAIASIGWLRRHGIGQVEATPVHAHMFFLGAAFLLMEVYAINRLALLFGTTWLVSAISIAAMLIEILVANLIVSLVRIDLRPYAYAALGLLLVAGYAIGPDIVLGQGVAAEFAYALFLLSPVLCAGTIFATSFSEAPGAGPALGANILGAVLGGWAEYATMVTGIRFMALVALGLYAASLIALAVSRRHAALPA